MSSFCATDLASLDKSLAGLRESLGKLRAAKPVDTADVTEQLRRAANSAGVVRELVWSELPEASWQSREELDHLIAEIQKILDARALEQMRSRLFALATLLERGRIVHRRANRVSELNGLRAQAINELRNQAGLKGVPPTLTGPQANQWIEWACSLQEPEDAESLQALRNGFPHLDDFVANLEPNMWIAAESPAVGTLLDRDEETPRVQSRPGQRRFDESSASSEPSVASRGGFDPRYVKVVDPRLTEKAPRSHPYEGAASSGIPAMQPGAAVLPTALASLDDSLAGMRETLGLLGAARSVELAEVTGYLKRAAEYARVVRESVWSELPEASWQTRKELDALVAQVQDVVEARALEQLRTRLLALATELEQGAIVHRRAHRLNELNQLRERAINELRSQAGLHVAPRTLPGPEAERWVAWAEALREPEDVGALQALRDGFPHLDDFIANLEPNLWVAAKPPAVEVPPEPEKPAEKKPAEKIPPSRMAKTRVDEPAALAEPLPTEAEAPSETRQEEAGFTELLDRLRRKRPRPSAVAEEEPQPISKEEPALQAAVVEPAREPVERTAPPVEPPPPSAEVPTEASAPGIALRVKTGAEELWSGDWRKLLAAPALLVCVALLLVVVLGAAVWRLRRNHAGVSTVQATEKVPDRAPVNLQNNGTAQAGMPTDAAGSAISAAQASSPKTEAQPQPAAATQPSSPKTEAAKPSKPQDQNAASKPKDQGKPQDQDSFAKTLASIKQGNNNTVLNPPAAAQSNTATAKKEEAAPPAVAPNGAGNIVQNIPVAVSTTTDRPPAAAAPQPTTTAALQPPAAAPLPVTSAPPASTGPQKVSSGVAQGLLVRQVAPQYPQAARQAHISGTVVLQVVIGKDGSVQSLHALSGPPLLVPSAMEAVKQWHYKPYRLNGEPVEANTQINVKFSLPNE